MYMSASAHGASVHVPHEHLLATHNALPRAALGCACTRETLPPMQRSDMIQEAAAMSNEGAPALRLRPQMRWRPHLPLTTRRFFDGGGVARAWLPRNAFAGDTLGGATPDPTCSLPSSL